MRAGQMRRRVSVQVVTRVADGFGGHTETPAVIATVWARIEPLEGREQIEAMQTGIQRPHRFTMRYRSDLTAASELVYNGRRFDVKSVVDPEERRRELHVLADEILAGVA